MRLNRVKDIREICWYVYIWIQIRFFCSANFFSECSRMRHFSSRPNLQLYSPPFCALSFFIISHYIPLYPLFAFCVWINKEALLEYHLLLKLIMWLYQLFFQFGSVAPMYIFSLLLSTSFDGCLVYYVVNQTFTIQWVSSSILILFVQRTSRQPDCL